MQDRPVGFNVTEVPCTQHPLIDVPSVHIAADLQGTVLVGGFWCKAQESPQLPGEAAGIFLSQTAYLGEARFSSYSSTKIAHHNRLHRSNHESPSDFCLDI